MCIHARPLFRPRAFAIGLRGRCRVNVQAAQADHKQAAAQAAIDKYVSSNSLVALGNGELVNHAIAYLGSRLLEQRLEGVVAIPASTAAAHEAAFHGVPLTTWEEAKQVDLLIDQFDQYDEPANAGLKGIRAQPQQPELPRLRQVLAAASKVVALVESPDVSRANAALQCCSTLRSQLNTWIGSKDFALPLACEAIAAMAF
eukprot:GHRR01026434.1.p1 GENE.GHRR01026434.1~~GHRR01026434.1.p1  ORF type:complete len:201 (+),score=57.34 GHRR01026434.1:170-772(+)